MKYSGSPRQSFHSIDMGSYFRDYFCPTASQRPTVGDTKFSTIGRDHMGWLLCDGTLLSTETHNLLFQAIGYKFGGSGTQFALPDARGRVPGAIGSGTGLTPRLLGASVGAETHTLTINQMPAHTHGSVSVSGNTDGDGYTSLNATGITANPHSHTGVPNQASTALNGASNNTGNGGSTSLETVTLNDPTHQHQIGSTGGGAAHNNMQPTLFIGNMFIYSGKPMAGTYTYF